MTLNSSKSYNENTMQNESNSYFELSHVNTLTGRKNKGHGESPKLLVFSASKPLLYTIPNFRNKFIKDTVK